MIDPNSINTNNIDYTHAREVYNKLMTKTELLNKQHLEYEAEAARIQLHVNVGLVTDNMLNRIKQIEQELKTINNQLKVILNDIRFMRKMTELNMPVNFN